MQLYSNSWEARSPQCVHRTVLVYRAPVEIFLQTEYWINQLLDCHDFFRLQGMNPIDLKYYLDFLLLPQAKVCTFCDKHKVFEKSFISCGLHRTHWLWWDKTLCCGETKMLEHLNTLIKITKSGQYSIIEKIVK